MALVRLFREFRSTTRLFLSRIDEGEIRVVPSWGFGHNIIWIDTVPVDERPGRRGPAEELHGYPLSA